MHPQTRFSIALLASLALWWPTLQGALDGRVDPIDASLRWVAAFVVASLALRSHPRLLDTYTAGQPADALSPATADTSQALDPEDAKVG